MTRSPEDVLIIPDAAHVRPRNEPTTPSRPRFISHYLVFNPVRAAGFKGRAAGVPLGFNFAIFLAISSKHSTSRLSASFTV